MRISYNEFHVSREVREKCGFAESTFASSGNAVLVNMRAVRAFAEKLNALFDERGEHEKRISAGTLNAMGLIDEIFHYVCMLYRRDKAGDVFEGALAELDNSIGRVGVDKMLLDFMASFPPVAVYQGRLSAEEYLSQTAVDVGTKKERTNREQVLEELILLHLANENPAFKPFKIMFDDAVLAKSPVYAEAWKTLQGYFAKKPTFGPFNHDLITLLREPVTFSPESLRGQLDYIIKYWADMLGEWLKRLLAGLDAINEEEKAAWHPTTGGDADMQPYSFENLSVEYERYSADSDWMPKVILMAKTVLVWLDQLTKKYKRPITRLDQIPDEELDTLRDEGFTGLWLIGLWQRSNASKTIKQWCGNPEAAASAYSLMDYEIADNIGGWDALGNLRARLWQRGIRLASDMVPNHTGMDARWVVEKPDLFIQRRDCPFPQYKFDSGNLSWDPRVEIKLEDHYYDHSDCAVVFRRKDNQTGDIRYIYHGNDGTGMPWNDTAQIDFLNPDAREAVMQEILKVARNFPIIRFDAAMVLAKKHIRRLWYPEPGHGGDIATRSETGLTTQQFNDAIPNEFWREVVDRVAREVPDTLLLAEAFWMMEGYFVRTLGMHRVYNSAFMNMLKKEENQKYRDTVKNTIKFDPQVLKRYVNFMNNPDEETAVAQFGRDDKYFGVCTLMVTMPGLPMFGHGQIEGFEEKYGMEYTKAYRDEKPNEGLIARHWHDIFPLMKKRWLFAQVEDFLFYDVWGDGFVNENIFAYTNRVGGEGSLIFYNNKYERAAGWIKQSCEYAVKVGDGVELRSRSVSEGLGLTAEDDKYCIMFEHRTGLWYVRQSRKICEEGIYVALNGFEAQVFTDIHQVQDAADGRYRVLCEMLNGKGCENLEIAWQEIKYKALYTAFKAFAMTFLPQIHSALNPAKANKTEAKVVKAVKGVIERCKDSALSFYGAAIETAANEGLKLDAAEKQFSAFSKSLAKVASIAAAAKRAKEGDVENAIARAKSTDAFLSKAAGCDAFALACFCAVKSMALKGAAKGFALGRKFNECANESSLDGGAIRHPLDIMFAVADTAALPAVTEKNERATAHKVISRLVSEKDARILSGRNRFNGVDYLNKEAFNYSLARLETASLLARDDEAALKMFATVAKAVPKCGYDCNALLVKFAPPKEKSKAIGKTSKASAKESTQKKPRAGCRRKTIKKDSE